MIEVRIPKEITEYKEKIIFGLSIRQIICFSIAIGIAIATWIFLLPVLGEDLTSYIVIFEVLPCFAIGFIRINGFTFEKYAKLFIRHKLDKNIFTYKTNTEFEYIEELGKEEWTSVNAKTKDEWWEDNWLPTDDREERIDRQKKAIKNARRESKKAKYRISKEIKREEKKKQINTITNPICKAS